MKELLDHFQSYSTGSTLNSGQEHPRRISSQKMNAFHTLSDCLDVSPFLFPPVAARSISDGIRA